MAGSNHHVALSLEELEPVHGLRLYAPKRVQAADGHAHPSTDMANVDYWGYPPSRPRLRRFKTISCWNRHDAGRRAEVSCTHMQVIRL